MDKSNLKKKEQLGEDAGTAASKLKKSILFHYIKKAGDNFCYQCGAEIENLNELSIEHKIPWLDSENPNKLFYDLDNIAFSHLVCNIGAARQTRVPKHPSQDAYKRGCRCEGCTRVNTEKQRSRRKKKKQI